MGTKPIPSTETNRLDLRDLTAGQMIRVMTDEGDEFVLRVLDPENGLVIFREGASAQNLYITSHGFDMEPVIVTGHTIGRASKTGEHLNPTAPVLVFEVDSVAETRLDLRNLTAGQMIEFRTETGSKYAMLIDDPEHGVGELYGGGNFPYPVRCRIVDHDGIIEPVIVVGERLHVRPTGKTHRYKDGIRTSAVLTFEVA